ncbi:MAG: DUF3631 domain-containing protein, partial [Actinomycetota bacterium]|nr:DUF3631 domain-containing protein [Actinomycetota bacterium]
FNSKNANTEPLRALLNAGNRRGTSVPRCVGPSMKLEDFKVFCAKALAGIGDLPDTIADRAIPIRLERKRPDASTARWRRREALAIAEPLQQELASWAQDAVTYLEAARPEIPDVLDDRAEEAWEPLLAIADLAGGHWPQRARTAALQLSAPADRDESLSVILLRDVRAVFAASSLDRLSSTNLAASLCEIEESPWGDLWGKALDARGLARRLKPFAILPRTVRFDDQTTAKGYHLEQFADAFSRYLGDFERHTDTTRTDTRNEADSEPSHVTDENERKPAPTNGCDDVTDKTRGNGHRPLIGDVLYPLMLADAVRDGHLTEAEAHQQNDWSNAVAAAQADGWPLEDDASDAARWDNLKTLVPDEEDVE